MKTLYLLRHAKSSWAAPGQPDRERPLKPRGESDAALVGQYIARRGPSPGAIFSSPALRARRTAEILAETLGGDPPVVIDALYGCSVRGLVDIVRDLPETPDAVLLVGHNPIFHAAALLLAEKTTSDDWRVLAAKFPTAALAILALGERGWADATDGAFRLERFITPRMLKDAGDG